MSRVPHVHLVQYSLVWEDAGANFERVRALVASADVRPGDLVVLPELFDSGFSLNTEQTADDGRTLEFLRALSVDTGAYVHGSRTVRDAGEALATNRATAVSPHANGAPVSDYAKVHPFTFGREPERFSGGTAVDIYAWEPSGPDGAGAIRVCPAVCYDLRFPELFRAGLARGAEMFVLGANWPDARHEHWRLLLRARAVENQAFVVGVNRTGHDPHLRYAGGSSVIDPTGEVLIEAGPDEGVYAVPIDRAVLDAWRGTFPAWTDARLPIGGIEPG